MMQIVLIFVVIMLFVLWPLPKLFKQASKKEVFLFIGLHLIGFLLLAGLTLQVRMPNPSDGMMLLFKPLRDWIDQFLA